MIVYCRRGEQVLYLVLHRTAFPPDFDGDRAWCPPSGGRLPGEPVDDCARRELREDTGLELPLTCVGDERHGWMVYMAEAPCGAERSPSAEHDRYARLLPEEAAVRCLPPMVGRQIARAAARLEARRRRAGAVSGRPRATIAARSGSP